MSGIPTFKPMFNPRTGVRGSSVPTPILENLWTYRRTHEYLGCSARFLQNEVRQGHIPVIRLGRSVRFDPADVVAYARARRFGGTAPISNHIAGPEKEGPANG